MPNWRLFLSSIYRYKGGCLISSDAATSCSCLCPAVEFRLFWISSARSVLFFYLLPSIFPAQFYALIRAEVFARVAIDRNGVSLGDRERQSPAQTGTDVCHSEKTRAHWRALMIFISARRKSGALICIPAIRLRAKCARLKTASAISRWSRLTRSTVFRLRPQNIKSCLRTSHRCIQIRL